MNWDVITFSSSQIQLHWASATLAFFLGLFIFALPKGTRTHRTIGWVYVAAMFVTAFSAIFIRTSENSGMPTLMGYSPIHLFIPLAFFGIGGALVAIRNKKVASHKRAMTGTFFGALIIAGLFTFLPGRRVWAFFFADPDAVSRLTGN
jgi:uncharacterized membrane protein